MSRPRPRTSDAHALAGGDGLPFLPVGERVPCMDDPRTFSLMGERRVPDRLVLHARALCWRCPVRIECGEYAIDNGEPYGMWGGMLPEDRALLMRARRVRRRG